MQNWVEKLRKNGLLKEISEPVDIDRQIAHISYIEVKKPDSKALLFKNPVDKNGKKFPPVLTNIFGSFDALNLILGQNADEIGAEISSLLNSKKPQNLCEKFDLAMHLLKYHKIFTKRSKFPGVCQQKKYFDTKIDLFSLPALKTWEFDGGHFITMGQVYTQSLDGKMQNLGLYRLQIYDKNHLGVHWQIHKDGSNFFKEYKNAGVKMPVSVAIGGDPLYAWCAQAPLPKGIFELLLYGFIRKKPAKLVKSLTNDIYIPHDADFVIEGSIDCENFALEGPFGDHTGFYTPVEPFPVMEVKAISSKYNPIFHATVVGKPPLEDKFMGYATERIFLPLFRVNAPELIDYKMPENGVFHNLILAKMSVKYPAHAQQMMHTFWGVGQMSFVKHAIFVDEKAPDLSDFTGLCEYVLNRISPQSLNFSQGICDQLDHASPNALSGAKLAIDATILQKTDEISALSDEELLNKFQSIEPNIKNLKQYFVNTKNPLVFIAYEKSALVKEIFKKLLRFSQNFKILIFFDAKNDVNNVYMSVWRLTNNIDALRDIVIIDERICIDATEKSALDGYERKWPKEISCSQEILDELIGRNLIENDRQFFKKYEI